jgi:hypothetical protein
MHITAQKRASHHQSVATDNPTYHHQFAKIEFLNESDEHPEIQRPEAPIIHRAHHRSINIA